ncbi:hypothetical protein SCG7109_AL_00070 [Chlamydiales bacterium SCGC AG-110-M15]|nr:hypothetical protein SCG7109_AL_00070 [Chlamydiales bacterium SCGC AG-110-M15]
MQTPQPDKHKSSIKYKFFNQNTYDDVYRGRLDTFSKLSKTFRINAEESLGIIERAINSKDFPTIADSVHSFKGMVGFFVDPEDSEGIYALCTQINEFAKAGNMSNIPEDFQRLKTDMGLLAKEIEDFIQSQS